VGEADGPARETNAITSRLVLLYTERAGGPEAVEAVLRRAGMEDRREQLLDENYWFSYDDKIALFEAVCEVLGDPEAMLRIGDVAMELNVGEGLKMALRALGSPRLVYQNVVRANAKFTGSHEMELVEIERERARIVYRDHTGQDRYDPLDCQYNQGLLACIPRLFGRPAARLTHPECGCDGDPACVYELEWTGSGGAYTPLDGAGIVAVVLMAVVGALVAPPLLVAAAAVAAVHAAWFVWRRMRGYRGRLVQLEQELAEQSRVFERLGSTLQGLVSDLRIDEVLAKVTREAQAALPGKEFALLVRDGDGLRCDNATAIPDAALRALEKWAGSRDFDDPEPFSVDDVAVVETLAPLAGPPAGCFRSLCAVPLSFRDSRVGILVALAPSTRSFLPRDLDLIASYAAQAAIAIVNGRLYSSLEDLASRDYLTGLFNHREFHERLEAEIARTRRYGGTVSLLLLDLDDFKQINDAHGHAEGDEVLRMVGAELASACRASDSAFRVGGDEFALLLPGTDERTAAEIAERTRDSIAGVRPDLDAAWGVAAAEAGSVSRELLLESADLRLYEMKRARAAASGREGDRAGQSASSTRSMR
jgi:diguanylate cyclase (GGDEF)-like protein